MSSGWPAWAVENSIPEPNSGCWLWLGRYNKEGRAVGRFSGRNQNAARAAWVEQNGPMESRLGVLHKCDNPACVNPDHLFVGTQRTNVLDMGKKGRRAAFTGERNGRSKLTESDVMTIRANDTSTCTDLARFYGVSAVLISMVRRNKIWNHVAPKRDK